MDKRGGAIVMKLSEPRPEAIEAIRDVVKNIIYRAGKRGTLTLSIFDVANLRDAVDAYDRELATLGQRLTEAEHSNIKLKHDRENAEAFSRDYRKLLIDAELEKAAATESAVLMAEKLTEAERAHDALRTALMDIMGLSGKWRQIAANARSGPRSSITGVRAKSFDACAADLEAFGAIAAGPPDATLLRETGSAS